MNSITRSALFACLFASVGLTACSFEFSVGGQNLNSRRLNEFLETEVEAQTGLAIEDVSCPEPRPIQEGDVFQCELSDDKGATVFATVTQTSDDGDVSFNVTGSRGIVDLRVVERQVASQINAQLDCGQDYLHGAPGATHVCQVPNRSNRVLITVATDSGDIDWQLQ
ncbi:MAG: DUF4333 domain-containing protein [Cyanobacteria bacterium P01_E01_bin.34]